MRRGLLFLWPVRKEVHSFREAVAVGCCFELSVFPSTHSSQNQWAADFWVHAGPSVYPEAELNFGRNHLIQVNHSSFVFWAEGFLKSSQFYSQAEYGKHLEYTRLTTLYTYMVGGNRTQ